MNLTAISASGSFLIGGTSSRPQTTTREGNVISAEFYAGRPIALPSARALGEVVSGYEQHPARRAALERARKKLGAVLHPEKQSLAALRMERGLSQSLVAERAGTSQSHIAKIESGKCDPGVSVLVRIAAAMALEVDVVLNAVLLAHKSASAQS